MCASGDDGGATDDSVARHNSFRRVVEGSKKSDLQSGPAYSCSAYQCDLYRVKCNMGHNKQVCGMVENKPYTGTGTDMNNIHVMMSPRRDLEMSNTDKITEHAATDMGLFTTDSDENYSDVSTRRKTVTRKNSNKPKNSTKKAETVPRRAKVRNKIYIVNVPKGKSDKNTTECSPIKAKSATYPRLEKTPYATDPSEGCPEYENAGLRRVQNMQNENKALGDLIKRNHDRQFLFG